VMISVRASLQDSVASTGEEELAESIGMFQNLGSEDHIPASMITWCADQVRGTQ
jgi:hypothetical protein